MKKSHLLIAAFALLLGACSSPKDVQEEPQGPIVFEISAVNSLDTRAIYSQEAVHSVENVKVYVFKKDEFGNYLYFKTFDITPWIKGSNFERYQVTEMLPEADYKFLGIGRDATDNFILPTLDGSTNYDNFLVSVNNAGQETEIFAGTKTATLTSQGMRIPIVISRQVAGVLAYFKNVPSEIGNTPVKFLRITVSSANKAVNVTTGAGSSPATGSFNVFNMDLSGQASIDGVYVGNDLLLQGVVKVPNSQLNGAFLMPVNSVTFTVGLYSAADVPLKTWTVTDGILSTISVMPNHFYSFGTKVAKNTIIGTIDNPTPDAPIDLLKDQSITVTITPAWAQIHNMVIQ